MAIKSNPLDRKGITPKGQRWQLMPLVIPDERVVYWDLRQFTGPRKSANKPD